MKTAVVTLFALAFCIASAIAEDWPCFRGPTRQGVSTEKDLPTQWSANRNVLWKTEISGEGWSSPIVWGERVFVTAAAENGASCRVLCLDRGSGKILWTKEVLRQVLKKKEGKNSYASPTPATDGKRVYAVFGDGGFAAVDFEGIVAWTNREFPHYSQHGLGSSPVLDGGLLVMARDGSSEGEDKKVGWQKPWDQAFIVALDTETGKVRWKSGRGLSRIAHVTPNVLGEGAKTQLVSGAGDVVQGFELLTGKLLWTGRSQGEGVVPSVVIGDGLAYTASGFEKPAIRAFRTDGAGEVTATHLAWEQTRGVPMIPSLLFVKPHVYSITTNGVAQCLKAESGEIVWTGRVGGNHSASPVYADGRIYFLAEDGETTVIKAGPDFEIVAKSPLGDQTQASPAISRGRIFIRTEEGLYCIGRETAQ